MSIRQATDEERAIAVVAHAMWSERKNKTFHDQPMRFVMATDVWGTHDDHYSSLWGIPVIHDSTLESGTILLASA